MRCTTLTVLAALFLWSETGSGGREDTERRATLLAVGDINLGRGVGQHLLRDSLEMPFREVADLLRQADVAIGNLESQVTDQGGETRHPTDPYVFCAPPQAAPALRLAGFDVLTTANNHAFDYGLRALQETIQHLRSEGVRVVGTSADSVGLFSHEVVEEGGIRFAVLAYTEFVNGTGAWRGHISLFEEGRASKEIARARADADVVVVSYHGGIEYAEKTGKWSGRNMRRLVDLGADLVLGHHPHVPLGVETYKGKLIFHSLGNFVFPQRQRRWTQRGCAAQVTFTKGDDGVQRSGARLLLFDVSTLPRPLRNREEIQMLYDRVQRQSNCTLTLHDDIIDISDALARRP
jgi:poly-gamma-glutamate synthesis protein (capsule biosynthesis protein)